MNVKKPVVKAVITQRFKESRKELCMTQGDLANNLGIKRSSIGAYEEGRALPPLEILQKLIILLDIPKEKVYDFLFSPSYEFD